MAVSPGLLRICLGLVIDLGKKNADRLGVPIKKVFMMVALLLEVALDQPQPEHGVEDSGLGPNAAQLSALLMS